MKYVDQINFVVFFLALIAFAIATGLAHLLTRSDEKLQKAREEIKQLLQEKADIDEMYKSVLSAGETQRLQDQAAVNALYGALTECQELHKASERQTVEVGTVKPATKRNSKGQFAKKVTSDEHIQPVSEVGTQENGTEA